MYYELYVDSLFLVNFVMNLFLLLLVNGSLFRTATRKRLILGAAIGAMLSFLRFFCIGPLWLKSILGSIPGSITMIVVAFRVRSIRAFFKIAEKLLVYTVLIGGIMLLLIKKVPWLESKIVSIWGVCGMGALLYLFLGYRREYGAMQDSQCKVILVNEKCKITVTALVDSGNSLVEPISGKPVSIVEKTVFDNLWEEEPCLYRAIPYHSIGKPRGILKGYLLPEVKIETEGVTKICKNIYIAVCEEYITSEAKMILNPKLLTESNEAHERRKKTSKERYGYNYDIESGSSG